MTENTIQLLLLSSDVRRRYAEDILTALALPPGSIIQFRYDSMYVVPSLQRATERGAANGGIIGSTATLAFISGADSDEPFIVPVRFAKVMAADCVADIFVFKLIVGEYVNLDRYPFTMDEIVKSSRAFISHLIAGNSHYYPAVTNFGDLHVQSSQDPASS